MRGIVDRIEEGVAVIVFEDGGRAYVAADQLPAGAGEGTVLRVEWKVEPDASAEEVARLIDRLRAGSEEHH